MASSRAGKAVDAKPAADSDSEDSRDEEGWDDVEAEDDEAEAQEVISLLDDRVFPDVMSMLAHCKDKHGFDFLAVRQRLHLDFHGCVKLVNFIRQRVHEGLLVSEEDISLADIDDDAYLKPVLDDDAVILSLFDLPELQARAPAAAASHQAQGGRGAGAGAGAGEELVDDLLRRNGELQDELARVTRQFENYRATVSKTLDERWGEDVDEASGAKGKEKEAAAGKPKKDDSKSYWESYAQADIHETMLKDTVRTDAYRDFIYHNKHLFAGKTVLDIGCGTGILSMMCARAGAARVFAVDASAIIDKARENVFHNGLDKTITCLSGRVEEVTLPQNDGVDIIVSEWMGYCLLFEAMLPSVLWARDRYLRPGGLMVPSHASLWAAPVADAAWLADHGPAFWADVYGFDMTAAMAAGLRDECRVLHWPADRLVGRPQPFKMLDLYAVSAADLVFEAPYRSVLLTTTSSSTPTADADAPAADADATQQQQQQQSQQQHIDIDGLLVWFDIFFSPASPADADSFERRHAVPFDAEALSWATAAADAAGERVAFTTGPHGPETHWKQGLLMLDDDESSSSAAPPRRARAGDELAGEIAFGVPDDHARGLVIRLTREDGGGGRGRTQIWTLH
ncbi:S-adenosyl-L-methionine-dependent methyltransferase [Xylariaceae sp. FL0804]|nr:S-adenosyl-L-methionine-dependent methyltransferase [Xylariaceae sp. FL0804]